MKWFSNLWHWLDVHTGWAGEIMGAAIILLLAALVHYIWRRVHARVSQGLSKTETVWDDALWAALSRPLAVAIWIVGIAFATQYAFAQRVPLIASAVHDLRAVALIILMGLFLTAFIREAETHFAHMAQAATGEDRLDAVTVRAIARLLRACVVIVMALIMLDTLGFSISGVLAFGGIGGLAVSFAAKDMLANFFGGLMLYWDRPFAVGDAIRSPDRELEGVVEHIGWRQTRIRTPERRSLYVPNSIFANVALENITRMTHRRLRETVGLRYDDAAVLPAVLRDIRAMLATHPELAVDDATIAHFMQFGDSSLNILVNTYTCTTDWTQFHRVREDVLLKIHQIVSQHGAEIAFPTRTLHVMNNDEKEMGRAAE